MPLAFKKVFVLFIFISGISIITANDIATVNKFKKEAELIIQQVETKKGLCIFLSSNQKERVDFSIALAQSSEMLIHGLVTEKLMLDMLRQKAIASQTSGQLMFQHFASKSLPYLSGTAKLLVVEDTKKTAIPEPEFMRVLAPNGVLAKKVNGKWIFQIKKRPSGMDDWTHPHHGPDGNLASTDTEIKLPISLKWVSGTPTGRGGFGWCASTRAVVAAGGRIFTIGLDDKGDPFSKIKGAALLARDAYSGLFLWKINSKRSYGKVELDWRNVWPIVATEKKVYSRIKDSIVIIDAITGKILKECKTTYAPYRLVLSNNTLVVSCWEKKQFSKAKDGFEFDTIRAVWWPSDNGSIEAFDAETGAKKWEHPIASLTTVASSNTVFALRSKGNPPTERELIAIDLTSGKIKWKVPHTTFGPVADNCLNFANDDVVVVCKTKKKGVRKVSVLSAKDGKVMYNILGTVAKNIIGDQLWCTNGKYDLMTGKKISKKGSPGTRGATNGVGGCIPSVVISEKIITLARNGMFLQLPKEPKGKAKKFTFKGARGACLQGMVPANGMLYTAQNNCACVGGQIGGFLALANHKDTIATSEEMLAKHKVIKGTAFGSKGPAASKEDWPTYRQNVERSGGSNSNIPNKIKLIWSKKVVETRKNTFEMIWNSRFGIKQPLLQPIIVNNIAYVTSTNLGEITAMDTKDGKLIWKSSLASRIDSPPTYYKGLLYAGCHDGFVHVLRAKDGRLAYRLQIAPKKKSIVAHGMVESLWPVAGSILLHDDMAYAMAGRSTTINGGLVLTAFKPASGEIIWSIVFNKGNLYRDALMVRDNELAFSFLRYDLKTGKQLGSVKRYSRQISMIDYGWSGGFTKRSGRGLHLGKVCLHMMAWNADILTGKGYAIKRSSTTIPKPTGKNYGKHPPKIGGFIWKTKLKPHTAWAKVNTLTISKNRALYAGHSVKYGKWFLGIFLWISSTTDGKLVQKLKLPAKACVDSFAISNQKVFLCLQDGTVQCYGADTTTKK